MSRVGDLAAEVVGLELRVGDLQKALRAIVAAADLEGQEVPRRSDDYWRGVEAMADIAKEALLADSAA